MGSCDRAWFPAARHRSTNGLQNIFTTKGWFSYPYPVLKLLQAMMPDPGMNRRPASESIYLSATAGMPGLGRKIMGRGSEQLTFSVLADGLVWGRPCCCVTTMQPGRTPNSRELFQDLDRPSRSIPDPDHWEKPLPCLVLLILGAFASR